MKTSHLNDLPALATVEHLCDKLCLSRSTVWRAMRDGKLKALRPTSRTVRFEREAVMAWLEGRGQEAE